jgi:hypothetical protein
MAFATTRNVPGGIQTDVSGASGMYPGAPGGMDMGWLMDLAKRRAQQKLQAGDIENQGAAWALQQAQKARFGVHPGRPRVDMTGGPARMTGGQARMAAQAALPEQTAAQRGVSAIGGLQSSAYRDMARQMMLQGAMGMQTPDYTGMTELARAMGPASAAAANAAGQSQLQQGEQNSPMVQAAQQQALATRMYPGLMSRIYAPEPQQGRR